MLWVDANQQPSLPVAACLVPIATGQGGRIERAKNEETHGLW